MSLHLWPKRHMFFYHCTVGQNQVVLGHLITHFPTSSGVSERASKRMSAVERASKASRAEQANKRVVRANEQTDGRATGPVHRSRFLAVLNHSAMCFARSFVRPSGCTHVHSRCRITHGMRGRIPPAIIWLTMELFLMKCFCISVD